MWRTVLVFSLAIINNISAQDAHNGTETQTKLCCPCPPGWTGDTTNLAASQPMELAASTVSAAPSPVGGATARGDLGDLDDCPCRARDADSEGAASLFFPNAVRAFGNVVRPEPKEESKPLLHPEVDLASSVLETLREATDEEYRDALERDAARAAASDIADSFTDGVPEEARNVVTIIVSPRDMDTDDALPEASHVQETRCIHSPLGNPRSSFVLQRAPVPHKGIEDILNLPLPGGLLHRQRDSNLAASNVQENVVRPDDNLNKVLNGLRLRSNNALNLSSKKIGENIKNILNNANLGIKSGNSGLGRRVSADSSIVIDSRNYPMTSVANEDNDNTNVLGDNSFNRHSDNQDDLDDDSSTLSTNDQQSLFKKKAINSGLLKSLLHSRNNERTPQDSFPLKNLLKLRDVELVPLDILKNVPQAKTQMPIIKIDPLQITKARNPIKLTTQTNLFGKPSKITDGNHEINLNKSEPVVDAGKSNNIQQIPRRNVVTTEILDALPSPSVVNCVTSKPEADKSAEADMAVLEDSLLNSSTETVESGDGLVNDVAAKEGDNRDVSNISSEENLQLKSTEILDDEEIGATDNFEIIDNTQPLEQDTNIDIQIISEEDIGDISPSAVDLSEINETEDRSNSISETRPPLKTLEEIRKSVVEKLNALQKSNRNALENIKHNVDEISQNKSIEERNQDSDQPNSEEEISIVDPTCESKSSPITKELRDISASEESVSFPDLQNMSDSILAASENHQRAETINDDDVESKEDDMVSEEITETDKVLGMDKSQFSETNPKNNFNEHTEDNGVGNAEKELCPSDLFETSYKNKLGKTSNDVTDNENMENDLEPLASDPIMDILRPTSLTSGPIINILRPNSKSLVEHISDFETKLRQSIVQPTPLINANDLNIFRTPSFNIPDISGLNANIPTLDEIRSRISEILSGLARSANDDDSSEFDSDDFASDVNPVVSSMPSSSNSILPPLRPLEDINLDIIQLKPLPSLLGSSPELPSLPGLNLNRYKAKLAVPKSLDLKPLNLASTLGNDGGLVGATLSVGPQKKGKSGRPKFKSNGNRDFTNTFRGTDTNPTLAEITSSVHKNALNLLHIPKTSNTPILQAGNVMKNFADDLRSHTEDTIRSIHESLNPPALGIIHNNLMKDANNLLTSGRSSLEKTLQTNTPINAAVDNLRAQTENTIKQLHNTLHSSRASDLSNAIQKNTHNILKSSRGSVDAAVDNLKAQSENTFKSIQKTFDYSPLADITDSIHKSAQNILKSSPISPARNILGSTMQTISPIDKVADNLRSHTKSTLKNIQQTLNSPTLSDINTSLQKSAQQLLNSPITNSRTANLKSALQPSMTIDNVVDNLKSQTQSTMRNIQNTLTAPSLADVSATVQKHAQNLLTSPTAFTGQVLQPMNLAPHAEQVAKDLQKTLKATLKNTPLRDLPAIPHPNDVLQMISNHQEDVNDKLFAIHTDLNDRLETLHNEVTDPERLRSILSPPGNRNFELFAIPLPLGARSVPSARKQPTLKAKQTSFSTERKEPKKITAAASKPKAQTAKLGSMRTAAGKEKASPKLFRMPSAASSPIPSRISKPILPLTSKPLKGLQGINPIFPPPTKNKVTVTFGSTTPRSQTLSKPKEVPTTEKPKVTNNKRFKPKPKGPIRQPTPWNGWSGARTAPKRIEPFTSPSRSSNVRTPLKSNPVKPINKSLKTETSPRLSSVSPKLKSQVKPVKTPSAQARANSPASPLLPLNMPKSPFLSKLSEALKPKPIGTNLGASRKESKMEMALAASDHFENVLPMEEPLKENVPYKCKMMCVKVDVNEE